MKKLFNKHKLFSILTLAISTLAFTACNTNSDPGTGTMKVSLTDAPAHYDEVNIEIRQVLVNGNNEASEPVDDGEAAEDSDDNQDSNGWYAIMEDSMTVNLLDYSNGTLLDLGETELEAGQYNQVRLLLGENNNVVIDGETYPLTTPSSQQSGYKLNVQATVEEGQVYELVIDFDAAQSITETGNNKYILKPVLRTVSLLDQGNISGVVLPTEAEATVYAITGEDTVGTIPNEQGEFSIIGLDDGSYNVWFDAGNDAYADSTVEDITIQDGEDYVFEEAVELESSGLLN